MNTRQINLGLQLNTAALASAALLIVVAGWLIPVDSAPAPAAIQRPVVATSPPVSSLTADSFAPIFDRSFQISAAATVAATNAATAVKATQPAADPVIPVSRLTLVGTVGDSLALIQGPDGTVAMVEPGDDLEGAIVVAIRSSQVDLRQNGKMLSLRKSPPPDDRGLISDHGTQPQ